MKRFGARYLTAAALGCLLILWALPASAYYPPLQATANWGWPWNWVYRSVYDPKLNKLQELTSQWNDRTRSLCFYNTQIVGQRAFGGYPAQFHSEVAQIPFIESFL